MAIKPLPEDENKTAEEGTAEGAAEGGKKKLDAKKIILFVVVPLLLLGGGGAGLYFSGMLDKFIGKGGEDAAEGEEHAAAEDGHGEKADKKKSKEKEKGGHGGAAGDSGAFVQIPNMLVNLTSEGQPRYLRLSVQLELEDPADKAAIEAVMPRVVDQFQTYLRELRVKDLRGSAGIYRLQIELLNRVNAAAYPVEVKDVLFQEILIQ
ncbi:MAG: flagellar basal body-associated FliL family protein [Micavibrio aeruginosavorus]|uniref:Flagellar protein FliL n=1 Tax=Micavibrio aeruginosavorus TaxID=349221 RepID=A0A7T5R1K7_9BACT|nr:MAG: flagellar basal body-associated FliL family protein [Micavibrio aeruginosavorus]